MQNELNFEPKEKFQKQYLKLSNYINSLEYSTKQKNILIDYYFKTFVEVVENGEYTKRSVTEEIEDFITDFEEWNEFRTDIENEIKDYEHEMIDPAKVRIAFEKHKYHEDDNTYLECVITYRRKIEESEYDSVLDKIVMDHIKKEYYKEKYDFDQLKRKFEDEN